MLLSSAELEYCPRNPQAVYKLYHDNQKKCIFAGILTNN